MTESTAAIEGPDWSSRAAEASGIDAAEAMIGFARRGLPGAVDVPYEAPDLPTLERALLEGGGVLPAVEHAGEQVVHDAIVSAAAPFRRPVGSYRFENRFRYLIAGS